MNNHNTSKSVMKILLETSNIKITGRYVFLLMLMVIFHLDALCQGVGISETVITPEPSAMLELRSSERGFLITRLTTTERDAIVSPPEALMIFNKTTKCLEIYVMGWHEIWCYTDTAIFSCGVPVLYNGYNYPTVQIGNQCWFAENLRTTQYSDGTTIPLKTLNTDWNQDSPAFSWYNNDFTNYGNYGGLYNWYALDSLSNGGKSVCPPGWSVPSEDDWDELMTYLSTNNYYCVPSGGGGNIYWFTKSLSSTSGWTISTSECTPGYDQITNNSTGFNAFPAGNRAVNGNFSNFSTVAQFWGRTETSATNALGRGILSSTTLWANWSTSKKEGRSIRCLKD
jgi:uncharacterized protein (TIGR02145 family)